MGLWIHFVKQWFAGESRLDAIKRVKQLNKSGIVGLINFLGEHHEEKHYIENSVRQYLLVLNEIKREKLDCEVSVKLSQLGLKSDEKYCFKNIEHIVKHAKKFGIFVWIDMENSELTQKTVDTYKKLRKHYSNVGICIQAYLKRSRKDIEDLISKKAIIRLVKGAYVEDSSIAFKSKERIRKSFLEIMHVLFKGSDKFAIATHDDRLVDEAIILENKYKKDVEFQMLMGVRHDLKIKLAKKNYRIVEYVPYGKHWMSYFMRRVRERPTILFLILRSAISK